MQGLEMGVYGLDIEPLIPGAVYIWHQKMVIIVLANSLAPNKGPRPSAYFSWLSMVLLYISGPYDVI